MGKHKHKRKRRKRKATPSMAERADPLRLYQLSVQNPAMEIEFFTDTFRERRGRKPLSMREDFCGTALLATEWAASHERRSAIGVDFDAPTLGWARQHVLAELRAAVRERVRLIEADVLEVEAPVVDVVCALNFSYCVFKQRHLLRRYFAHVREGLGADGIFYCELYGGSEAIIELEEEREVDGFTYVWDQDAFNPITRETRCYIHFAFPDGSRIDRAFTYDWRLWTIPEVRECLLEAGFSRVDLYWDPSGDEDDEDEGLRRTEAEENQEGWLVYFVAAK